MNEPISRRKALTALITLLVGFWTTAVAALSGAFLSSTLRLGRQEKEVLLGDLTIYGKTFRALRMRVPVFDGWNKRIEEQTVFIRANENDPEKPIVLSGRCSHLGCTVAWNEERGEFACPCHGGRFDAQGKVTGGPPPTPLTRLHAELRAGDVYVKVS